MTKAQCMGIHKAIVALALAMLMAGQLAAGGIVRDQRLNSAAVIDVSRPTTHESRNTDVPVNGRSLCKHFFLSDFLKFLIYHV